MPPRLPGPTYPCPRCGCVVGQFLGFRVEHLKPVGWQAYRVESYVNWCGHGQEVILLGDNYICAPCCLRKECYQGTRLRPAQF